MKIGLLAMSGVRAHDPELLALGLTLPAFVQRSQVVASLPSLGLLYLAACTPAGHEVRYFEAEADGKEPAEVYECNLVAISSYSAQIFEAYAIADRLRARGVKVAIGGLHVTARPAEAAGHADYVVVGEGENVWPAVVAWAAVGGGARVFRAEEFGPVDIENLPVPRYDLLAGRAYNRFTVQTTRGCVWRCEFCASNVMLRTGYRKRPVGQVVRDVEAVQRVRPRAFIELADDNTFVDKAWGRELCRGLEPLRVRWFTETDLSVAEDGELLELMRRSGCRQVLVGLESPTGAGLEGLELRANAKARWAEKAGTAVERIQEHGITVNGCFVLGLDGQGPEVFEEVLAFAERHHLWEVQVTVLTPFPGTPLYERLEREGRLLYPGRWERCTLFDINYRPAGMSVEELRAGLHGLMERLYSPECVKRRRGPMVMGRRKQRG